MPTDEMLMQRFQEIQALNAMEEGEIEQAYGLKPGEGSASAYRKGTIDALCRISIIELEQCIRDKQAKVQATTEQ